MQYHGGYVYHELQYTPGGISVKGTIGPNRKDVMLTSAAPTVDSAHLRDRLRSPAPPRILDVRTPAEFETAHIAGSYNVPLDLLREHRDEIVGHLTEDIVLVCRSGQRATQAGDTLRQAGLLNVHILDGGITAWQANGYPVNRGAQRWDLERQVRLVAGCTVLLSILASIAAPKLKWLAAGMGGVLAVAALTNTCAMGSMLSRLPYHRGAACELQTVVAQLAGCPGTQAMAS